MNSLKSKIQTVGIDHGAPYVLFYVAPYDSGSSIMVRHRKKIEALALKYSFLVQLKHGTVVELSGRLNSVDELKDLAFEIVDFSAQGNDMVFGPSISFSGRHKEGSGTWVDIYPVGYSSYLFSTEELRYINGLKAADALSDSVERLLC